MTETTKSEDRGNNQEYKNKLRIIFSILFDTLILLIWVLATWGVHYVVKILNPEELIDKLVFDVFVWGFGISTICTTLFQLIEDLTKAGIQTYLVINSSYIKLITNFQKKNPYPQKITENESK